MINIKTQDRVQRIKFDITEGSETLVSTVLAEAKNIAQALGADDSFEFRIKGITLYGESTANLGIQKMTLFNRVCLVLFNSVGMQASIDTTGHILSN